AGQRQPQGSLVWHWRPIMPVRYQWLHGIYMTYRWIDRVDDLQNAIAGLKAQQPLYLDTEFMRERTFWPQLALVQVNTGDAVWLIDAPALADPAAMAPLCADHPLVMHACSEDIEALKVFTGA